MAHRLQPSPVNAPRDAKRGVRVNAGRVPGELSRSGRYNVATEDRGFASMERNKQREIASKGGKAAHQKGTAHEWTSEEAREAGRKGGMASHRRKQEQQRGDQQPDTSRAAISGRRADVPDERSIALTLRGRPPCAGRRACRSLFASGYNRKFRPFRSASTGTGRSSNGRTHASGACYRGSNPCLPAKSHFARQTTVSRGLRVFRTPSSPPSRRQETPKPSTTSRSRRPSASQLPFESRTVPAACRRSHSQNR